MLTDMGLPFLYWLRNKTIDFGDYLDSWIEHLCPCGGDC